MLVRSTIQNRPQNFTYPKSWDNGERGVYAGGGKNDSNYCGDSRYINISTPSNGIAFGSTRNQTHMEGASGRGRGLIMGGRAGSSVYATIDYVTIATPGNVTNFGNLIQAKNEGAACSNGTRTLYISGLVLSPWAWRQNVDYVTIATAGNAADFGDLIAPYNNGTHAATGDGVVGVCLSSDGSTADYLYFTIATPGNATKWGDARSGSGEWGGVNTEEGVVAASNGSRGVYGGGYSGSVNLTIDYITFATPSNALQWGKWYQNYSHIFDLQEGTCVSGPGSRAVYCEAWDNDSSPTYLKYFNIATAASTSTQHGTNFGTMATGATTRRNNAAGFAGD